MQNDRYGMRGEPLKNIKEQRYAPEGDKEISDPRSFGSRAGAHFKQCERENRRTQRHQEKIERGRVLCRIDERKNGEDYALLFVPMLRFAVNVPRANHTEEH